MIRRTDFPNDFLWGASTAAHQVEGGTVNQWSTWELANATNRAKTARQRLGWLPDWSDIRTEAETPANYVSGRGVDHYNKYRTDLAIAERLGLNAFRFGIEWSRLQPREGVWDSTAIAHYREYITTMRGNGLEPILTLWHWTMPTWFTDKGGFEKRQNIRYFEAFVERVVKEYGTQVRYILVLNETNVYTSLSYITGIWPPNQRNLITALSVYRNLVRAHKRSYAVIKRLQPHIQVGCAQNLSANEGDNAIGRLTAQLNGLYWNWWFTDRIKHHIDFIGFNFYNMNYWHGFRSKNPAKPVNDLGWYMEPARIAEVITALHTRYGKPIMITENGVADRHDTYRQWWLEQTINGLYEAVQRGATVIGYLHWSLLDNFEWADGWWPRFGLVAVDRKTMARTVRDSAKWWGRWLHNHKNIDK